MVQSTYLTLKKLHEQKTKLWSLTFIAMMSIFFLVLISCSNDETQDSSTSAEFSDRTIVSIDPKAKWRAAGPHNASVSTLLIGLNSSLYAGAWGAGIFIKDDESEWELKIKGLDAPFVSCFEQDPNDENTIYAGTTDAIRKTTDGGQTWFSTGWPHNFRYISSLCINPQDPSIIYAAAERKGAFKSTDYGSSWSQLSGFMGSFLFSLAIDHENPERVYTATNIGLFISDNGGETWDLWPEADDIYSFVIKVDPQNPDNLYVGTADGVYRSENRGESFSQVNHGLPYTPIRWIAIDPLSPEILYASSYHEGVFKSNDRGDTWFRLDSIHPGWWVSGIHVNPTDPDKLYLTTHQSKQYWQSGVFSSTDGGNEWIQDQNGLMAFEVSTIVSATDDNKIMFITEHPGGISKTSDGGETWRPMNTGLSSLVLTVAFKPDESNVVYCGTDRFYISSNGGEQWQESSEGMIRSPIYTILPDRSQPNILYVGKKNYGVWRSTDGGATWHPRREGIENKTIQCLTPFPDDPQTILAASGGKLFKTSDAGATWAEFDSYPGIGFIHTIVISEVAPNNIYVGMGSGLFVTSDRGQTWVKLDNELKSKAVVSLILDKGNSAMMFAATKEQGVWWSSNGGATWKRYIRKLPNLEINDLALVVTSAKYLYAGTQRNGLYRVKLSD